MRYRLYIDEVGNPDLGASEDPNHRYLSLTGVIFEYEYREITLGPWLKALKKKHFGWDDDDDEPLHRRELIRGEPPFVTLRDKKIRASFNNDLLRMLEKLDFLAITVVIDKLEHRDRYAVWRHDPYHYCLQVLVERYVQWLNRRGHIGDVLAEQRGRAEDTRLKDSFKRLYEEGTEYVSAEALRSALTSKELKVKPKLNNIAGLQITDLIAYPSYKSMKIAREGKKLPNDFGKKVVEILERSKYLRSPGGKIDGWGRKWLP